MSEIFDNLRNEDDKMVNDLDRIIYKVEKMYSQAELDAKLSDLETRHQVEIAGAQNIREQWKIVPDHPDYEASTMGRVRRCTASQRSSVGFILKPTTTGKYLAVSMDGNTVSIHRIVARTFLGECPDGMQVDHLDSNKEHNCIQNLEYVTLGENIKRADEAGLIRYYSDSNGRSRLSNAQVSEIKSLLQSGSTTVECAERFGVSIDIIQHIKRGERYKEVPTDAAKKALALRESRVRLEEAEWWHKKLHQATGIPCDNLNTLMGCFKISGMRAVVCELGVKP